MDHNGNSISGDAILGLAAMYLKEEGRLNHDVLVVTIMSNMALHKAMEEHGIKVVETKVGDRNVIASMRKNDYSFGGEESGHVIFKEFARTGDGLLTALQIMLILKKTSKTLAELVEFFKPFPNKLTNLNVDSKPPLEEINGYNDLVESCKIALKGRGRHLIRYSGTEKKVRILIEAESENDVDHWTGQFVNLLQKELCS